MRRAKDALADGLVSLEDRRDQRCRAQIQLPALQHRDLTRLTANATRRLDPTRRGRGGVFQVADTVVEERTVSAIQMKPAAFELIQVVQHLNRHLTFFY